MLCAVDPTWTFEHAFGFAPLPWQVPYLWEPRNAVTLKGRQVGASTCAAALCIQMARSVPNSLAAIVSPSMKQSSEVKLRAKTGLQRLGEKLVLDSATLIGLDNGSRIMSLPGSAKSVRGWTADLLVIDEAAFLDPDTFLAARATVATGGRVIVQSTPAAPYGHFFDLYTAQDLKWAKFQVSSEDVGTIDPDFLISERATLSADDYAQEYQGRFTAAGVGLVDPMKLNQLTQAADASVWAKMRGGPVDSQ
jgi:hypothetical protein